MKVSDFLQIFKEYGDFKIIVNESTPLIMTNVMNYIDKEIKEISFDIENSDVNGKTTKIIKISLVKEQKQ